MAGRLTGICFEVKVAKLVNKMVLRRENNGRYKWTSVKI